MVTVLGICHAGLCSPLHVCELASQMRLENAKCIYFGIDLLRKHANDLVGVVDITHGVTVVYLGDTFEIGVILQDFLIYVRDNRTDLIEAWSRWHAAIKSSQTKSKNG